MSKSEPFTLTDKQQQEYREKVAKQGTLQARATLRARYLMNQAKWWNAHKAQVIQEWDRIDGEERK